MEVGQISALLRLVTKARKLASQIVTDADALGLEQAPKRKRRRKTGEAINGAARRAAKKMRTKPGPSLASEEQ